MRPSLRHLSGLVSLAVVLLGCGSDDPAAPAPVPESLAIVDGDDQWAVRGDAIPSPLRVRVVGTDGQPLRGATVQWAVVSGEGVLAPAQSVTGDDGEAETTVAVVGSLGAVIVSATVTGVTPVVFTLTGQDPCEVEYAKVLTLGAPHSGSLAPLDCVAHAGQLHDLFLFTLPTAKAVTVTYQSTAFDPEFELFAPSVPWFWYYGDSVNATRQARMKAILPAATYLLVATMPTPGPTGPYQLRVDNASTEQTGCEFVLVYLETTSAQKLSGTDCAGEGGRHEDRFAVVLMIGEPLVVTATAGAFAPRIRILLGDEVLAATDATAPGAASVTYVSDRFDLFWVHVSGVAAGATGDYTLDMSYPPLMRVEAAAASLRRVPAFGGAALSASPGGVELVKPARSEPILRFPPRE